MSTTWAVDPEFWRSASAQIRESSTKLHEGTLSPAVVRNETIQILQALAGHTPDNTGYLQSLMQIVQDSTDEKLAKVGLIAVAIAEIADSAADLDEHYRGLLGP